MCRAHKIRNDEKNLIVLRAKFCFVIMNLYPYNSGHIMVVPYRHVPSITDLTGDESLEIMTVMQKMVKALKSVSGPDGFNIGSNIGRVAGAGIEHHIHFHIVPRWLGDTNFMPVIAETKMISEGTREIWSKLRKYLSR